MLKVFIMEDNLQQLNNLQAVVKTILLKLQVTDSLVLPFSSTTSLNKALPEPSADNVFILDLTMNCFIPRINTGFRHWILFQKIKIILSKN